MGALSPPRLINGSDYLNNRSHLPTYRIGQEGEDSVVDFICQNLDGNWTVFRNVSLPDRKGDIDIVLVGRGGIYALEVKTFTGEFHVENGSWHKKTSNGRWAKDRYGPGAQARQNAKRLCQYLKSKGIEEKNYVEPKVVLSQDTRIQVASAATEIWTIDTIGVHLASLGALIKLSPTQVDRVVAAVESATVNIYN